MNQDVVRSFIKKHLPLMLVIGVWIGYLLLHIVLRQHKETAIYVGVLAPIIKVCLDLVNASLAFCLWKRTTGQRKTLFAFFSISFLLLTIADANFYILGIASYPEIATPPFRISFTGFLIFQFLAWATIFLKSKSTQNKHTFFISYLPVTLIILIIFTIFLFASFTWKIQISSLIELYVLSDAILQITGFVFALLCLAIATNKQIRFIATGYLGIIAMSFFTESSYLTHVILAFPFWESMWFLGLFLITFGLYDMLKEQPSLKMDRWLNNLNSVQSQCALWSQGSLMKLSHSK